MAWRFHGKAAVDIMDPSAFGTCDRCGALYNLCDLSWQHDWRGSSLQNLKLLVCRTCLDQPSPFYRSLTLPPDPTPLMNARPEPYAIDETD
jgi:hypothetical protein